MLLNRFNGYAISPFHALSRELDSVFGGFLEGPATADTGRTLPRLAVWETEDGYQVEAELPGVLPDDLDVSVHGNRVTLKGERKETAREGATALRREWNGFDFERSFDLPVDIDDKGVVAELEHGILRLTLPKAPGHKPQKVKVLTAK